MPSVGAEPSTPETMTSRASIVSGSEATDDQIMSLAPDKRIATQSLTGRNRVARVYNKSAHYIPLACLALCLNPPLGVPAFMCAFLSRKHRVNGNEEKSARYSHWAFWLSLVAIASSIVIIVFVIVYVHVITPNIILQIDGLKEAQSEDEAASSVAVMEVAGSGSYSLNNATITPRTPP